MKRSHRIKDIKEADLIITATNAPEAVIVSDDLKSGAMVIDDAQPSDVSSEVLQREDVLVIEAGIIHTRGISTNFNMGLKDRYDNFCCLGEVLILASAEFNGHYSIGRGVDVKQVDHIVALSQGLNFRLAEFQNFNESINQEKIDHIRSIIHSGTKETKREYVHI